MMKCIYGLIVFTAFIIVSCNHNYGLEESFYRGDGVNTRSSTITDIDPPSTVSGFSKYHFLLIADMHYGGFSVPEAALFSWLSARSSTVKPKFCIVLGDVVNSGTDDEYAMYASFQKKMVNTGIPVYTIVGNHDLYNDGWNKWKNTCFQGTSAFGTSYYRFKTSCISWYFLDTGNGTLGSNQLTSMRSEMKNDGNPKLVFTHYPVYAGLYYFHIANETERALILDAYARYSVKYVFEGHNHDGGFFDFGSFKEDVVASLGEHGKWYDVTVDESSSVPVTAVEEIGS